MIEYTPKDPAPITVDNIVLDGKVIGWIEPYITSNGKNMFHAGLQIDVDDVFPHNIYGHGCTKEAAITNAMDCGFKLGKKLCESIEALEAACGL